LSLLGRYTSVNSQLFACLRSSLSSKSRAGSWPYRNPALMDTTSSQIAIPASMRARVTAFIEADFADPSFSTTQM